MPANMQVQSKETLMIPDRITPYDNLDLLPPPSSDFFSSQIEDVTATPINSRKSRSSNRDINLHERFVAIVEQVTGLAAVNPDDTEQELTTQSQGERRVVGSYDGIDTVFVFSI